MSATQSSTSSTNLPNAIAVVIGASGGIGAAVAKALAQHPDFTAVVNLHRRSDPPLDLLNEDTIAAAAAHVAGLPGEVRLVFDATGVLQDDLTGPEKALRQLDPARLAHAFAINAIGPALLMKHFLPLLPRQGRSVFATLSARVGSIGDNALGGWYGYRASKAALNQFVRTAAVELARQKPEAICVALHPGTVATALSDPHAKAGLDVRTPDQAADLLLKVLDDLRPAQSGAFLDYAGDTIAW